MTQPTTAPLLGRVTGSGSGSTFTTYVDENPKLCGFLLKQSDSSSAASKAASAAATIGFPANAGRLPSRKRWFVFNETTCRLYWYKSPSDLDSLGDIDILSAAFEVVVGEANKLTTFKINTSEKSLILEAADSKTMMYWLQELQSQRQKHVKTLTRSGPPGIRIPRPPSPRTRRKNVTPQKVVEVKRSINDNDEKASGLNSSLDDNLVNLDDNSNYESHSVDADSSSHFSNETLSDNLGGRGEEGENDREVGFDDLMPRVEAPVDSVGAGSAVVGVGGGGRGGGLFRRESLTKKSIRGKMMKFLPGRRDGAECVATTATSSDSPRAVSWNEVELDTSANSIRKLNRSPDLHRRSAAASSASIVASSASISASPPHSHSAASYSHIALTPTLISQTDIPLTTSASVSFHVTSSPVASSENHASTQVASSTQFYGSSRDGVFPSFGSSTTSLPDASF